MGSGGCAGSPSFESTALDGERRMVSFQSLGREELQAQHESQQANYADLQAKQLKLDLTRGKPSPAQLDLSNALLEPARGRRLPRRRGHRHPQLRRPARSARAARDLRRTARHSGGQSDRGQQRQPRADARRRGVSRCCTAAWTRRGHGFRNSGRRSIKFLCPVPGYDRHFAITESLGIEMINIPMREDGPDVDLIEELVAADPAIKGMWCVPVFSNPTGVTFAWESVRRLVQMQTAASDFRLFWDNAYAVHTLTHDFGAPDRRAGPGRRSGQPEPAAGVRLDIQDHLRRRRRQLLRRLAGQHRLVSAVRRQEVDRPRQGQPAAASAVLRRRRRCAAADAAPSAAAGPEVRAGRRRSSTTGSGSRRSRRGRTRRAATSSTSTCWPGTARRTVSLAKDAGIAVTEAGASFPYRKDPEDKNIRIAPTFPSLPDLREAIDGLATCALLAATEALLKS